MNKIVEEFVIKIEDGASGLGAGSSSPAVGASTSGANSIGKNIAEMAAGISIIALFWSAIGPILKPVLSLLRAIMTVIFIPLLPLIKDMASSLADMIPAILKGQKEGGFLGGLGAIFEEKPMLAAGGLIAAGIITALGAGGKLAGVLTLTLGFGFALAALNAEDFIPILKSSFMAGIATGIATLMLGGTVASAIPIGGLVFSLTAGISLIKAGIEEEDWKVAIAKIFAGSIGIAVAGAIVGMITGVGAATVGIPVGIGALIFGLGVRFNLFAPEKAEFPEFGTATDLAEKKINDFGTSFDGIRTKITDTLIPEINTGIMSMGENLATNDNSTVSNLSTTGIAWGEMKDVANQAIDSIIKNLNNIPREIVTTHTIKTVRET